MLPGELAYSPYKWQDTDAGARLPLHNVPGEGVYDLSPARGVCVLFQAATCYGHATYVLTVWSDGQVALVAERQLKSATRCRLHLLVVDDTPDA